MIPKMFRPLSFDCNYNRLNHCCTTKQIVFAILAEVTKQEEQPPSPEPEKGEDEKEKQIKVNSHYNTAQLYRQWRNSMIYSATNHWAEGCDAIWHLSDVMLILC